MTQKKLLKVAICGLFAVSALTPSCKPDQSSRETGMQESSGDPATALSANAEALADYPAMARQYTTDNNPSLFVEDGRLLAQNRKGSTKQKTTKAKKAKKASHLPGQFPESSERLITVKDVEHQTPWGMKVMLNEIYARQGYIFQDKELKKHFSKEKWYRGRQRSMSKIKLSPIEVQNISFIKNYQQNAKI